MTQNKNMLELEVSEKFPETQDVLSLVEIVQYCTVLYCAVLYCILQEQDSQLAAVAANYLDAAAAPGVGHPASCR